jgi:regulator of replication initiation timing
MLENFDPTTIQDETLRQVVIFLMNQVESLHAKVQEQAEEIQRLRNENNRLKGEQGKPVVRPNKPAADLSSRKERRESQFHKKGCKQTEIRIDRIEVLKVVTELLPKDAVFKGYDEVVVQDLDFRTDNVKFRKEKFYSPSEKRTFLAEMPPGYTGQFGPGVRAWVLALSYAAGMSEPKILELLHTVGLQISRGQLSDFLIKKQEQFHTESQDVLRAGLTSSSWQHLDSTATRIDGKSQNCHVLCNPWYIFYCTLPAKDRLSLIKVLLGGREPSFRLNERALSLLEEGGLAKRWRMKLEQLSRDQDWSEGELDELLDKQLPKLGPPLRKRIKERLAIVAYQSQHTFPVVELLVCDDAPQSHLLTAEFALCWLHEWRHYKKLMPRMAYHRKRLKEFGDTFWKLYHQLLAYRQTPSQKEAEYLRSQFERLFGQTTGYEQLDERMAVTLAKKERLLMVLRHPEIPLHNNPAELGARQRVRKRDVSLQARTKEGIAAWDAFQTVVETAKKLGVNIYCYVRDRITQHNQLPSLATLIMEQSQERRLDVSWFPTK